MGGGVRSFDAHLIGIDPDYRLQVSPQLLDQNDGPMLEGLKKLRPSGANRRECADGCGDAQRRGL